MSLVDRLNRWIGARVHADRPELIVEGQQLALRKGLGETEAFRLSDLTQATLSYRDVYAGDAVVLRLGFRDGRHVEIFQDDPLWFDLMTSLDRSGLIAVSSTEWQLHFLAAGDRTPELDLLALRRA